MLTPTGQTPFASSLCKPKNEIATHCHIFDSQKRDSFAGCRRDALIRNDEAAETDCFEADFEEADCFEAEAMTIGDRDRGVREARIARRGDSAPAFASDNLRSESFSVGDERACASEVGEFSDCLDSED